MFRYINMPKLVAFYLREFSIRADGEPSTLYKFIFCLCLPFLSQTFLKARMNALAIAECTNSAEQIFKVLEKLTDATVSNTSAPVDYPVAFGSGADTNDFSFDGSGVTPLVYFGSAANTISFTITLNGVSKSLVQSYLDLLIPFYINTTITWQ